MNFLPSEITQLLRRIGDGEDAAEAELYDRTYEELKRIAQGEIRWEPNGTLQATALVHDAFMRLRQDDGFCSAPNRRYFFASVANAMRRILVDAARARRSKKRGGNWQQRSIDHVVAFYEDRDVDLEALDEALEELEKLHPQQAQVVKLRWLTGRTIKEVAEMLDVSTWKVEDDWRIARAFLYKRLCEDK